MLSNVGSVSAARGSAVNVVGVLALKDKLTGDEELFACKSVAWEDCLRVVMAEDEKGCKQEYCWKANQRLLQHRAAMPCQ